MINDFYFNYEIKCGKEIIHQEIIKVETRVNNKRVVLSNHEYTIQTVVLNNLFARDSMSFHSHTRPIRERAQSTKLKMDFSITPLSTSTESEEAYKLQMETRDKSLGYLLDEPLILP